MLAIRVSRGFKGIAFSLKPVAANARLEGKFQASNKGRKEGYARVSILHHRHYI